MMQLIAHVSDFHVFADEKETALVRDDAASAAHRVVSDLAGQQPPLNAVIITGDLTDGGSVADYALLKGILTPLRCPVLVVPGNHDRRSTLRAAFGKSLPFHDSEFLNYEVSIGNLRVLALDTLIEGQIAGRLCAKQLDWLSIRLAEPCAGPTIIAMHHPGFDTGIAALDHATLVEGRSEFARIISRQAGPIHILCGHVHRPVQARWQGHHAAIAGSPAFQVGLDLGGGASEPLPVSEPYAYFIHRFDDRGDVSIHTRYVSLQ